MARFDRVRPQPVIEVPGLGALPEFALYPLPDQVADKVCAMYDSYGMPRGPSTRFRDLVDLALIVTTGPPDGELTASALHSEARRRGLTLPTRVQTPGPGWRSGYAKVAHESSLSPELHNLEAALAKVGEFLDPLLSA